jgi:RNAse (barnase) inhibitor barstar
VTAFRDHPSEFERLDWRILQNGAIALYYKPAILEEDVAWLAQHGYRLHQLDGARWESAADFHGDAKRVLGFPEHYGGNLGALNDCLTELAVPGDGGMAIVLRHFDVLARRDARLAHALLDALESASRRFLLFGRRLLALVQSDDPRIRFDRVGERPVCWNAREWLDSSRGLSAAS